MCWHWRRKAETSWIDVLVDIDGTIANTGGPFRVPGLNVRYGLVAGALEFLVALDRIPDVRLGFYSAGNILRNEGLVNLIVKEIYTRGHCVRKFDVFTVAAGMYGKKSLKSLRKGLDLQWTILVDDLAQFSDTGEERNLLKVYRHIKFAADISDNARVYDVRRKNNLVRALGIILQAMEAASKSNQMTLVEALHDLQWDEAGTSYLHEATNTEAVYQRGLEAMKAVNPNFSLCIEGDVLPYSPAVDEELFPSDIFRFFKDHSCSEEFYY